MPEVGIVQFVVERNSRFSTTSGYFLALALTYHVPEQKVLPYTVRSQSYDLPNGNYTYAYMGKLYVRDRMKCAQMRKRVFL